ncbi:MAG: PPOX class F420-dependent oxidoreductase [Micromonosporaceae bacterium]
MSDRATGPAAGRVAALAESQYVLVTSYRKDGTGVGTPLWVVPDGDALAVWTPTESYKVKRMGRDPRVEVAPCTYGGSVTGEAATGRAELLDAAGTQRVRDAIKHKYGLVGWLTLTGSWLRRGYAGTIGIRITLDA